MTQSATVKNLNKFTFNNFVVDMRGMSLQVKNHTISHLIRNAKKLRTKKTNDEIQKKKNTERADRFIAEVNFMKKLHVDDITKFSVFDITPSLKILNDPKSTVEQRALSRLSYHKKMRTAVDKFHSLHPKWDEELPFLIKSLGLRHRRQKLKKLKERGEKDIEKYLLKEELTLKIVHNVLGLDLHGGLKRVGSVEKEGAEVMQEDTEIDEGVEKKSEVKEEEKDTNKRRKEHLKNEEKNLNKKQKIYENSETEENRLELLASNTFKGESSGEKNDGSSGEENDKCSGKENDGSSGEEIDNEILLEKQHYFDNDDKILETDILIKSKDVEVRNDKKSVKSSHNRKRKSLGKNIVSKSSIQKKKSSAKLAEVRQLNLMELANGKIVKEEIEREKGDESDNEEDFFKRPNDEICHRSSGFFLGRETEDEETSIDVVKSIVKAIFPGQNRRERRRHQFGASEDMGSVEEFDTGKYFKRKMFRSEDDDIHFSSPIEGGRGTSWRREGGHRGGRGSSWQGNSDRIQRGFNREMNVNRIPIGEKNIDVEHLHGNVRPGIALLRGGGGGGSLHPSWEAKRKLKIQSGGMGAFEGKRMTFEDD